MKESKKKSRKSLWLGILAGVVAILLIIGIVAPMVVCDAPPLRVFDLNPEEVTEIQLKSPITGQFLTYTEPEEIEEITGLLNGLRLKRWYFIPDIPIFRRGGWDQGLSITTEEGSQFYTFSENSITVSDAHQNEYSFYVTDGLEELLERAK